MAKLPLLSGRAIVKALEQLGYRNVRQRGSHMRLLCERRPPVTVPDYKMVSRGLLKKILCDAELFAEDFLKLL